MKKFYTTLFLALVYTMATFAQGTPKVMALDKGVKKVATTKAEASKTMTRGSKEKIKYHTVKNDVWGAKKAESQQTSWVWDFEDEAQIEGWTFIDNDGDGHNWTYFNNTGLETGRMTAHEGEGLISSASYDNDTGTPLTPDNWMISPKVTLGGALKFWACGQDASYSAEKFAVYVCVGDPAGVGSFTKVAGDFTATGEYVEYAADLRAYEGQEGCFAIRHYNVTDMFWLNIDDITLDIEETYVAPPMTPENVTADPGVTTADIAWEQSDDVDNWNLRYRPYVESGILYDFPYPGYEEQISEWLIYDADGDDNNWGLAYTSDAQNDLCFYSASYTSSEGALSPDNWLFSPEFELGGSISFKTWNQSASYPDKIQVYLFEGEFSSLDEGTAISDFIIPGTTPEKFEFDLSEYSGKGVIAFRHYDCEDQWMIFVDDIEFVPANAQEPAEWIYVPDATNPYTIEELTPETEYEVQVQAFRPAEVEGEEPEISAWTESTIFTTLAETEIIVTVSEAATDGEYNYATMFYSEKSLAVPEGIKAYTATVANGEITLHEISGAIPAGTAVVLRTDSKLSETTDFEFSIVDEADDIEADNMLKGTDEATTISGPGFKYYMLSLNGDSEPESIGFYFDEGSNGGTQLKNGAHKAYLAVPDETADAKGYPFGGDATGIEGLNVNDNVNANSNEIFDLQGRKMNGKNLPKGIYIVNGKKIVVK